jgi:tetratricopeptide (TPR) repeat protein
MVAWSHELLPLDTRRVFARLGVFVSSLTLEAAEAVGALAGGAAGRVLDHITTLVDHSLLVREPSPSPAAPSRYRLLETLRLFALDRLAEAGGTEEARRAHAEYYLRLAAEGGPECYGPDEVMWQDRLLAEEPNLHAALDWAAERDPALAVRLAVALWPYWDVRWGERHANIYVEKLLARPDLDLPDDLRAWALTVAADLAANPGDARRAVPLAREAVDRFRALADERGLVCALLAAGWAFASQGSLDEAEVAAAEGLARVRRLGDPLQTARALDTVSFVAYRRGEWATAREYHLQELDAWVGLGSRRGEAIALRHLAVAALGLGELDEAVGLCERALAIWRGIRDPTAEAHVLNTLADVARTRGDLVHASALYDRALTDLRAAGDRRCTASTFKNQATIAALVGENERSAALFGRAIELRVELDDVAGLAECFEGLAGILAADGRHHECVTLLAAAAGIRSATGSTASAAEADRTDALLRGARSPLGDRGFEDAHNRGRELSPGDAVTFAIAAAALDGVTRR